MYLEVLGVEVVGVEAAAELLFGLLFGLLNPNVVHFVGVEERSKADEFRLDCVSK